MFYAYCRPMEIIFMKRQTLLSKNKKKFFKMPSAALAQRILRVKISDSLDIYGNVQERRQEETAYVYLYV